MRLKGHSALYVLVPVPNCTADIDWLENTEDFKERVISAMEKRAEMSDIREHIKEEVVYTPKTWMDTNIQFGATFNLAHSLNQMMHLRPRNKFEDLGNCYLVEVELTQAVVFQRFTNQEELPLI